MFVLHEWLESPLLGLCLTGIAYLLASRLNKYKMFSKLPPVCLAAAGILIVLKALPVDVQDYNRGADFITYILGPATIALALPLVNNVDILKKNWKIILAGVTIATIIGISSVFFVAEGLKAATPIVLSLVPKSVTTPIAIEVSKSIGGIPELTSFIVIITGLMGALLGHRILKLAGVKNNISIGLAIGASSHVFGTSKCVEKNETQAAISGVALILVGLLTSVFAPIITKIIL